MLTAYDVVRWFVRVTALAGMLLFGLSFLYWLVCFVVLPTYGGVYSLADLFIYILLWFFSEHIASEMVGGRQKPALNQRDLTPLMLSCVGLLLFMQGVSIGLNSMYSLGWGLWALPNFITHHALDNYYKGHVIYSLFLCVLGFFMAFGPRILFSFAANKQQNPSDGPYSDISQNHSPDE